jgi:hypothetical protein
MPPPDQQRDIGAPVVASAVGFGPFVRRAAKAATTWGSS